MADRVHPSAKPALNGTAPNSNSNTNATTTTTTTTTPASTKPQIYRPYRPNSSAAARRRRRRHARRCPCTTCCCCFWTILLILCLCLLVAIAGAALYVLYRPHSPSFTLSSLRTTALNLTTSSDASISHLTTSFNIILTSKNPNSHFTFVYDPFTVSFITPSSVFLGNGTVAAFSSGPKNFTTLRAVVSVRSMDLDTESASLLRSDMRKRNGVPVRVLLDTRVTVTTGKLKSKRVGIRVSCEGIKGISTPQVKGGTLANVGDSKCKVDLRIKIWRFTF